MRVEKKLGVGSLESLIRDEVGFVLVLLFHRG